MQSINAKNLTFAEMVQQTLGVVWGLDVLFCRVPRAEPQVQTTATAREINTPESNKIN